MSTTLEQRQAVGTEAEPKVIRKPGRGPIWPFIVAGVALMAVVVAGVAFSLNEPTPLAGVDRVICPQGASDRAACVGSLTTQGQALVTGISDGGSSLSGIRDAMTGVREGGAYVTPAHGTVQDLGTEIREGGAYGMVAATGTLEGLAGSHPPPTTDWWNQTTGTGAREGGTYDDAISASQVRDLVTTEDREG